MARLSHSRPLVLSRCRFAGSLRLVGDYGAEVTPVPIPNTAVKLCSADGTAGAARWESTSSPAFYRKARLVKPGGPFSFCGYADRAVSRSSAGQGG